MKIEQIILVNCILLAVACQDDLTINTDKNTLNDEIADITFLGNSFYTTNNDNSMHAGPQIDLFRFSEDASFIEDAFDLEMNGQGYLAITDDGANLYLQSHWDTYILKISPIGQKYYMHWMGFEDRYVDENGNNQWDESELLTLDYNSNGIWDYDNFDWLGCGISYIETEDLLFELYRFKDNQQKLMGRKVDPETLQVGSITFAEWDILDSTNSIFAMEYVNISESSISAFYFLAQDTSGTVKLLKSDYFNLENFSVVDVDSVDSALGLGWDNDCTLYFSYPDKRLVDLLNICE